MKITLIPERCIACGLCQTYSDIFDYHDNGIVKFASEDERLEKEFLTDTSIQEAVKNCPTRALIKD